MVFFVCKDVKISLEGNEREKRRRREHGVAQLG
jgi:hypothetical protein